MRRKNEDNQKEIVIDKLLKTGFITRNECLRMFISRLSSIIQRLEEDGWEFKTGYIPTQNGVKDYCYWVTRCPLKKQVYTVNGKQIVTYVKG